jgi:hypothetical protein
MDETQIERIRADILRAKELVKWGRELMERKRNAEQELEE